MKTKSWAQGDDGVPVQGLDGWKHIRVEHPTGIVLTDQWGKDALGKPAGSMLMTIRSVPAWVMWYGEGSYPQRALPFLRESLMVSYNREEFYGGRGPTYYSAGGLTYINMVEGNFNRFRGREAVVCNSTGKVEGYHTYGGQTLFARDID